MEFALIHLAFLGLTLVVPLAALAVAIAWWRARRPLWHVAGALFVAALPPVLGYEAAFREPYRLRTEAARVLLDPARGGRDEVRVGVLADLQTDAVTDHERRAVDLLLAARPDVILLPGDFFQGSAEAFEREREPLRRLLARLEAPGGAFAVSGNVDSDAEMIALLADTPVRWLPDEIVTVRVGDRELTIGGVGARAGAAADRVLERLERDPQPFDVRILLSHYPDRVLALRPDTRVDLVVSGHTHGGQVRLPLVGPLLTFSAVPRRVAAGGLHVLDGRRVYVSRGVGWERDPAPRIRFRCPPEVTVLTLAGGR